MAEFRVLDIKFSLGIYNQLMQIYKPQVKLNKLKIQRVYIMVYAGISLQNNAAI